MPELVVIPLSCQTHLSWIAPERERRIPPNGWRPARISPNRWLNNCATGFSPGTGPDGIDQVEHALVLRSKAGVRVKRVQTLPEPHDLSRHGTIRSGKALYSGRRQPTTSDFEPAIGHERASILDCGGKRSATPLSSARCGFEASTVLLRSKAPSTLRSAGAVQDVRAPVHYVA
jgi:hypothetical protein